MYTYILQYIGPFLLIVSFGYALGRTASMSEYNARYGITVQDLPSITAQSTVSIDGIHNGYIEGTTLGEARLFIGGEQIFVDEVGNFRTDATALLTNIITVQVPPGMQYVASRKGKKYYQVASAAGSNITVKNRVYFATAAEAERAGYKK